MINYTSLLIAVATPLATLLGIIWGIYQYSKETTRKKRSETLNTYNILFDEIYNIREIYYKDTNELLFSSEKIHTDIMWHKKIMILLTHIESFAMGIEFGIYDFEIFISLTPKEMVEILNSLKPFVDDEREIKEYDKLFDSFMHLANKTSDYMQNKINNKSVKKCKKIRV